MHSIEKHNCFVRFYHVMHSMITCMHGLDLSLKWNHALFMHDNYNSHALTYSIAYNILDTQNCNQIVIPLELTDRELAK